MKCRLGNGKRWLSLLLAVSLLLGCVPLGTFAAETAEEAADTAQMTEAPTEETTEAAGEAAEATEESPETTEEPQPAEETPEVTQPAQAAPAAEEHVHDYQPQEKAPTCTEPGYRGQVCTLCGDVLPDPVTTDITASFHWTDGTMIQATSGSLMTHSTWMASDYVDISGSDQIRIITADTVTADSTIGLAFYDANKVYISGVRHTDSIGDTYGILVHQLTVPENAVYIRSTWYSQNHPGYEPSFGSGVPMR